MFVCFTFISGPIVSITGFSRQLFAQYVAVAFSTLVLSSFKTQTNGLLANRSCGQRYAAVVNRIHCPLTNILAYMLGCVVTSNNFSLKYDLKLYPNCELVERWFVEHLRGLNLHIRNKRNVIQGTKI